MNWVSFNEAILKVIIVSCAFLKWIFMFICQKPEIIEIDYFLRLDTNLDTKLGWFNSSFVINCVDDWVEFKEWIDGNLMQQSDLACVW